ncbi:MAG: methylated-DNA--[protein]-cysteine S-methyltransferase [Candidatus Brocadia sp.]|jgi:methylated-DNA-[protein]-cysteine S-methyltransferase
MESPIGTLMIIASDSGLKAIMFEEEAKNLRDVYLNIKSDNNHKLLRETEKQLNEYFAKKRSSFDLPLDPEGTSFQKKAWEILSKIPYGRTISYSKQAELLGNIKKTRAVGMANSKNPLAIIIPCHRVIGKNGTLTGYTGGMDKKMFLLSLEGIEKCVQNRISTNRLSLSSIPSYLD